MPRDLYTQAMLGVYELNRTELLRDVFIWAYERSSARYTAIQQSLGEPDPFRLRYRDALRHIDEADRGAFRAAAEDELLALHEGNFARYGLRPAEFNTWRAAWGPPGQRSNPR